MMALDGFSATLSSVAPHPDALDRAIAAARDWQNRPEFEDDFSLVQFHL
jgi:hypothetical protein